MSHSESLVFIISLVLLILFSAFFSCAETGLMAINRYRLRHQARMKKRSALLISNLLKRPDRLLGMILIGNNCANILASALATVLAIHYLGEKGVVISTLILTLIVLIFAEVAPKTLAALYPEKVSHLVAWPVYWMLKLFYPLVWLVNTISNGLLWLFRVNVRQTHHEPLSRDELRSVLYETAGRTSSQYQTMLLGILDLNKATVDEVMIPQHQIVGIDIEQDWNVVRQQVMHSQYGWLPIYRDNINQTIGMLHLRDIANSIMSNKELNKESLIKQLHEPYFVPESTPLNTQLLHFQKLRKRIALVVDEYGDIQGLLTLEDILEEIVGEFTTNVTASHHVVHAQSDGSYLVEGSLTIRELNRAINSDFPTSGPRTLNGLITEYLESIPRLGTCVKISDYPIEIVRVKENRVEIARIFPRF